jgi:hypothetical protein
MKLLIRGNPDNRVVIARMSRQYVSTGFEQERFFLVSPWFVFHDRYSFCLTRLICLRKSPHVLAGPLRMKGEGEVPPQAEPNGRLGVSISFTG